MDEIFIFVCSIFISVLYGLSIKSLLKYKDDHLESDSAIRYMISTLICAFLSMWSWQYVPFDYTSFAILMFSFFGFFGVVFSIVAIYQSSFIFFDAYKHLGNEQVGKNLMWGYLFFVVVPAMFIVVSVDIAFTFIVIGFYGWNFISDSIMEMFFWRRLRNIRFQIGSDIEAATVAVSQIKRLFAIKFGVVLLSTLIIAGFVLMLNTDATVFYAGLDMVTISLSLMIPCSATLLKQRLYCSTLIPKISMGLNAASMTELENKGDSSIVQAVN